MEFKIEKLDAGNLIINSDYSELLRSNGIMSAEDLWKFKGESVKKIRKERGTEKALLKYTDPQDGVCETFIKRYLPTPFKEYFKCYSQFKPLVKDGAIHEWDAIISFHEQNLPTMIPIAVAKCSKGTCNMTLGITGYTRAQELFEMFAENKGKYFRRKRNLIKNIAELASGAHSAGFCHQDFYLVHMFVKEKEDDSVYLIDLQRLIIQEKLSKRWRVKDLGQLLYSSRKYVSKTDMIYFWKLYSKKYYKNRDLIKAIFAKAERIRKHTEK